MKYLQQLKKLFLSDGFKTSVLCLIVVLLLFNFYDRRVAVRDINTSVNRFQLSRTMLNSRAQIQIILCYAALEGRPLRASEADTIKRLWQMAEYDRAYDEEKENK